MRWWLAFVVVCLGCASGPKPVTDRRVRVEHGFAFRPPSSENWFAAEVKNDRGHAYTKKIPHLPLDNPKHNIICGVRYGTIQTGLTRPEEILNFVRMQKENQLQGLRFEVRRQHHRFIVYKGARCLEFDSLVEDRRARQMLSQNGLFCLHPEDHRRYVDISFGQKYAHDRMPLDVRQESEAFVRGVAFATLLDGSLKAKGDWPSP